MENEEKPVITTINLEKFEGKYTWKICRQEECFSFTVLESFYSALKIHIDYVKQWSN